jgi:hypothetical protein
MVQKQQQKLFQKIQSKLHTFIIDLIEIKYVTRNKNTKFINVHYYLIFEKK